MFLIWGVGSRQKTLNYLVNVTCGGCGVYTKMNVVKTYVCGTIFFIPIIKAKTKYFVVCPHCGEAKQITKNEFKEIKNACNNGMEYYLDNYQNAQPQNQSNNNDGQSYQYDSIINVKNEQYNNYYQNNLQQENKETSISLLIIEELNKTMEQIKRKNYVITPARIEKLKVALKQNLTKRFDNEKVVNITIDNYFNNYNQ